MTAQVKLTLVVEVPLDLRATLRPLSSPWGRFQPDGWWRPFRTPEGPATLHLRRDAHGIHARLWGRGSDWLAGRLGVLVGLADHPEDFVTDHPLVGSLHRRHPGLRFGATGLVFEAAVRAVVAQKVTGKEAGRSLRGLIAAFGEPAPGPEPGLRVPPDPSRLAEAPYHRLHPLGIERRRAETLRRLATAASRLEGLGAADEVRRRLQAVAGIGVWTSAETVAVSHGDPDAVSVGDYHLKNVVAWHLQGRERGTDAEMMEALEPFRPHRGRVTRLLETLGGAPRFGPRRPVRTIRSW